MHIRGTSATVALAIATTAASVFLVVRPATGLPFVSDHDFDRVESRNKRYFAIPTAKYKKTIVFEKGRKPRELWRVPGWGSCAYLSNDGEYLVVGYEGVNLLEPGWKPNTPMLTFFVHGKQLRVVPLSALIRNFDSLQGTDQKEWGMYQGYDGLHFAVETVEGRTLTFDITNGALVDDTPTLILKSRDRSKSR